MLRNFPNSVPIITVLLMFWGFCGEVGYYSQFGVNIYAYLTPSEIIMSFFPSFIDFLWLLVMLSLELLITVRVKEKKPSIIVTKQPEPLTVSNNEVLEGYFKISAPFMALVLIFEKISTSRAYISASSAKYFEGVGWVSFYYWIPVVISIILLLVLDYKMPIVFLKRKPILFAIILGLGAGIFIKSYYEIKANLDILHPELNKSISFTYDNNVIKSDSTKIFVGETQNYIFLCNIDRVEPYKRNTEIYNKRDLKSLIINYDIPYMLDTSWMERQRRRIPLEPI